jgi:hypothetical protein
MILLALVNKSCGARELNTFKEIVTTHPKKILGSPSAVPIQP